MLLDRHNYITMERYIGSADNLKLMMNMLADSSRSIAYEAFHVFKVRNAGAICEGASSMYNYFDLSRPSFY